MPELPVGQGTFEDFENCLETLYDEFTFERAAAESQVPIERIEEAAKYVEEAGSALAAHTWRSASIGNLGGWQVARCLFFLNVLTGSVATKGGTAGNGWNKFAPPHPLGGQPITEWNELSWPKEYPLAYHEMSILLPHFLN
jgi:anaerobic selenocysteine-containing dehydrogenase